MATISDQQAFFMRIKTILPAHISLADEIAELLNISNDSAYRRIRGEKPISFEEIQLLCKKYHLSLDQIMNLRNNCIVFNGNNVDEKHFDLTQYLNHILSIINNTVHAEEKCIYYEAKDIPLFYFFHYPLLGAFKYFFWMKTILSYSSLHNIQFEDNELEGIVQQPGKEIADTYTTIPSVEIWGTETVSSIIKQIMYYNASGMFRKKETPVQLLDQLKDMLNHIKEQAEYGEKLIPGNNPTGNNSNFRLFTNEVFIGQNTVLVEADGSLMSFINHNVLNYMITPDVEFCRYTKNSVDNAMKKSELISVVGEKDRNIFFNTLQQQITNAIKRL